LSWIKKIFTRFQNDHEEDINDIEVEPKALKARNTERNQKKDLEARVLYQYPKGQFRFPLIPDEDNTAERSQVKKKRAETGDMDKEVRPLIKEKGRLNATQRTQPVKAPSVKQRHQELKETRPNNKPETFIEPAGKFKYEPRKDSVIKSRQPFRPTEIPSPIYAYNRPPQKNKQEAVREEIEYELTGFELADNNMTENANGLPASDEILQNGLQHSYESEEKKPYIKEELPNAQEFSNAPVSEEDFDKEQYDLESEALNKIFEADLDFDAAAITDNETETTIIEAEFAEYDNELTEDIEEQLADETESHMIEAELILDHETTVAAEVTESETETNHSGIETDSPAKSQNAVAAEKTLLAPQYSNEPLIEEKEPEAGVASDEAETIERPKRQLPFNVLMLKQDKKKWEERKASKYPSFMDQGNSEGATGRTSQMSPAQSQERSGQSTNQEAAAERNARSVEQAEQIISRQMVSDPEESVELTQQYAREENDHLSPNSQPAPSQHQPAVETLVKQPETVTRQPEQIQPLQTVNNQPKAENNLPKAENNISVEREIAATAAQPVEHLADDYEFPPLDLLNPPVFKEADPQWLGEQEHMLNETLRNFNVGARVVNVTQGPSVTRFEVQPEPGVKVNKITNLSDDIKLSLAAKDIRIEAPIPGKHTIGIEVPNHTSRPVLLSEILQGELFLENESPLAVALGLDIAGNPIITDLKKMPHGLIAGATGSGKSVCINTMLVSLLYKAHPDEVKLLLIDPKMVELAPYNNIPHLVSPVITDVKAATASLKWAVEEMERRYELFAHTGVRDIGRFNELAIKHRRFTEKLPYIVIVIDELADLMMMAPGDVEEAICRIAQKARACGIHLIIATQRPSVDVITGLIKANVPTRIAFSVSSQIDSRTIIDISGAEKLLGRGDMLFLENGSSKPFRLQGTFVTDNEIDDIVAFARDQRAPQFLFEQEELLKKAQISEDEDELFYEACEFVVEQGGASTSSVQRRFKIGYNRAARLIEMMEQQGFISEGRGSKPRDVLISAADLESLQDTSTFN
jgi:S-DNA-T family DNA segregation ATPase FtsK/SpoIIIE